MAHAPNKLDFAAINAAVDLKRRVEEWCPGGTFTGPEYATFNPRRPGDRTRGSFSINTTKGVWKDFACEGVKGSDAISLYAYLFCDDDQGRAARELAESHGVRIGDPEARARGQAIIAARIDAPKATIHMPIPEGAPSPSFRHPRYGEPSWTWTYKDAAGAPMFHILRYDTPEGKQIVPRTWATLPKNGDKAEFTGWSWKGFSGDTKRPLYGLNRLAAYPDRPVIVVEGEKAADAAQKLFGREHLVVSWYGGCSNAPKVDVQALAGRDLILWPDFDSQMDKDGDERLPMNKQPGIVAMMHIASLAQPIANSLKMVSYTPFGEFVHGWDLFDAVADGWDKEKALAYMAVNSGDPWAVASGSLKRGTPALEAPRDGESQPKEPRVTVDLLSPINPFMFHDKSEKGAPLDTRENLEYMMDQYGITARYNEVSKNVEVTIPTKSFSRDNEANCTLAELDSLAARNNMPRGSIQAYTKIIAENNSYSPPRDWIESKPWDGKSRLQPLYDTITVAEDQVWLKERLLYRWLLSAVAALYKRGEFIAHGALVFTGAQGLGKTSWFRRLVPVELEATLMGAMVDPANKDSVTAVISHWIVELGELDATFRKADIARLKSFVTLAIDKLRRPYDRIESGYQRRTVFCASVNDENYLVDDTGNRRWWTIAALAIDYTHDIDMQQVFAELLADFKRGEQWHLTTEEQSKLNALNEGHEAIDPVQELVASRFDWNALPGDGWRNYSSTDVLTLIGFDKPNKSQATHMGKILKKMTGKDARLVAGRRLHSLPPLLGKHGGYEHDSPI